MATTPSAWRQSLRPASFRGVPFLVQSRSLSGGRRTTSHEYPGRDEPYVEDLGRKQRSWSVEAFVVGPDYMAARDKLLDALEKAGPGEYVDRWGIGHTVQVTELRVSERQDQGGMAVFSLSFVEAGAQALPTTRVDTGAATRTAADAAIPSILDDFAGLFSVRGPERVQADALTQLDTALATVQRLASGLPSPSVSGLSGLMPADAGKTFALLRRVSALRSGLSLSLFRPADLGSQVQSLFAGLVGLQPAGTARYAAAKGLAAYDAAYVPPAGTLTTVASRTVANRLALGALVRRSALIEAARASADLPFAVHDDAVAERTWLSRSLAAALNAPDPVYRAMTDLRIKAVRDITARGADLTRLAVFTPAQTLPSLYLAQRLYGDAGRAAEIVARNPGLRHPGFVPGGNPLQVLHV
jgi:prophage DNA circulation protein